jgi:hypothetical protein
LVSIATAKVHNNTQEESKEIIFGRRRHYRVLTPQLASKISTIPERRKVPFSSPAVAATRSLYIQQMQQDKIVLVNCRID